MLPVALPLGVALFALLLVSLRRRSRLTWPRAVTAAVVATYAAGIFANTVFPIYLSLPDSGEPWTPAIALIPFYDYEVQDALMNIGVFVPLGFLLPLLMRRASGWRVVLGAVGISLGIEMAQLATQAFFGGGHIADINDLLWNTVGGAVGYGIYVLASRTPGLRDLLRRFRWDDASSSLPAPAPARA